jgi:chromate transporter
MVDCMAVAQAIPGAVISNASVYIGQKRAGLPGAIAACLGALLPAFASIIIVMLFLDQIIHYPRVLGFFKGALAGAAALVALICVRLGKNIVKHPADWLLVLITFALIVFLNINTVWVLLGGAVCGFPLYALRLKRSAKAAATDTGTGTGTDPGANPDPGADAGGAADD